MKTKVLLAAIFSQAISGCGGVMQTPDGSSLMESSVAGTPSAFAECKEKKANFKDVENGTGVMFDDGCNTAFVLPPVHGTVSVQAMAPSANLQFCKAMGQAGQVADSTMTSAASIAEQIKTAVADAESKRAALDKMRIDKSDAEAAQTAAKAQVDLAETTKADLATDITDAKSEYDTCVVLASPAECAAQKQTVDAAKVAYLTHQNTVLLPAKQKHIAAKQKADTLTGQFDALSTDWIEFINPLLELQQKVFTLNVQVMDLYKEWAQIEGATGTLQYTIPWSNLLQDYKTANPTIFFSTIRIIDGTFFANTKLNNTTSSQIPALLWSEIPGYDRKSIEADALPTGSTVLAANGDKPAPSGQLGGVFNSLNAQIGLSLVGACPFYPGYVAGQPLPGNKDVDYENLSAFLVVNAQLKYDVTAKRSYKADYRMSEWVRRVEKHTKKKGFLSSSAVNSVTHDGDTTEWFKISFDSQASGFVYSPEEQRKIAEEVKADIVDRSLRAIGRQNGTATQPPAVPEFEPIGASQTARYIRRGCWYHVYCQTAGWIVGSAGAIFGSSQSAISNFTQSNDVWIHDEVNEQTVLERTAMISFAKPGNE